MEKKQKKPNKQAENVEILTSDQIVFSTPVWTIYMSKDEQTGSPVFYEIVKNLVVPLTAAQVEKKLSTAFLTPFDVERLHHLGLFPTMRR
jgi:hypothetical protein